MRQDRAKFFESLVSMYCDGYAKAGVAKICKVDPPTKTIGGRGFTRTILLKSPFLDFTGVWTAQGGRALHIECKSTEHPRLPICVDGGLTAEQFASLEAWEEAGACVGILWLYGGKVKLVSLAVIRAARLTRASVPWADAYDIERGTGLVQHDFLKALAGIYGLQ